jgi:enoyl-CoA hydratase/carnithine racemase
MVQAERSSARSEPKASEDQRNDPVRHMKYTQISVDSSGGIATVTLDRPEKLNAFTATMGDELLAAFRAARDDAAVRAIVLAGAGRSFCAGVDLEALRDEAERARIAKSEFLARFPLEVAECPKPTLCALHGSAIGVGVTMVLPFDLRVAAEGASLGLTFAKLGILPGLGSAHLLPRLVGRARARELVLTARVIDAAEAERIGLVNKLVPEALLGSAVRELAERLAGFDPDVLAHAKQMLDFGERATLAETLANDPKVNASLNAARKAGKS